MNNAITITDSARDKHTEATKLIEDARRWAEEARNEEELLASRRLAAEMERSYYACLVQMMMVPQDHDGSLEITSDSALASFFWRHEKSGYHGGMIFHKNHKVSGAVVGTWSVHT
jgi:hypothetical protein